MQIELDIIQSDDGRIRFLYQRDDTRVIEFDSLVAFQALFLGNLSVIRDGKEISTASIRPEGLGRGGSGYPAFCGLSELYKRYTEAGMIGTTHFQAGDKIVINLGASSDLSEDAFFALLEQERGLICNPPSQALAL